MTGALRHSKFTSNRPHLPKLNCSFSRTALTLPVLIMKLINLTVARVIPLAFAVFAESHLLQETREPVGKIVKQQAEQDSDELQLWGLRHKKPEPSMLYQLNDQTLLCVCSPSLLSEDFYQFSAIVCLDSSASNSAVVNCITVYLSSGSEAL